MGEERRETVEAISMTEIRTKSRKRFGVEYPGEVLEGHRAEIVPGVSITLHGSVKRTKATKDPVTGLYRYEPKNDLYANHFEIGSWCEVHSYNLVYTGRIRKITAKVVEAVEYEGTNNEKVYRMDIANFTSRNWDFDMDAACKRNSEWSD